MSIFIGHVSGTQRKTNDQLLIGMKNLARQRGLEPSLPVSTIIEGPQRSPQRLVLFAEFYLGKGLKINGS